MRLYLLSLVLGFPMIGFSSRVCSRGNPDPRSIKAGRKVDWRNSETKESVFRPG